MRVLSVLIFLILLLSGCRSDEEIAWERYRTNELGSREVRGEFIAAAEALSKVDFTVEKTAQVREMASSIVLIQKRRVTSLEAIGTHEQFTRKPHGLLLAAERRLLNASLALEAGLGINPLDAQRFRVHVSSFQEGLVEADELFLQYESKLPRP